MEGFRGHDCAECLRDGAYYVVRFEEGCLATIAFGPV